MKYSIGRGTSKYTEGDQIYKKLIIPNMVNTQDVAAQHATLSLENGLATIAPVNPRQNRIFVNGFEVKRKQLRPDHVIRLGEQYQFFLHYFFITDEERILAERHNFDFKKEFRALENVWQQHLSADKKLRGKTKSLGGISKLPYVGGLLSHVFFKDLEEKARDAQQQHVESTDFTCPMCRQSLLPKTWSEWKQAGGHPCGAVW